MDWKSELQWGRARMSAEILSCDWVIGSDWIASMGPRSDERGNNAPIAAGWTNRSRLQWGRARMSAEIKPLSLRRLSSARFNGAALG